MGICLADVSLWSCLQYTIAMMGYGPEDKNAVLELTYNYGITKYDKGNAYAQVDYQFLSFSPFPQKLEFYLLYRSVEEI